MPYQCLTTAEITRVFGEAISDHGGHVTDTYDDGRRLFTRSLLPHAADARPGDGLKGGLALKADEHQLSLHPYVFRQVCRNGAVMAHSLDSLQVDLAQDELAEWTLREAIAEGCRPEVFARSVGDIRSSLSADFSTMISILPHVARLPKSGLTQKLLERVLKRFFGEEERTRYGLMNAVTSLARDTREPETRWRLEELGGAIGAGILPEPPADAPGVEIDCGKFVSAR